MSHMLRVMCCNAMSLNIFWVKRGVCNILVSWELESIIFGFIS